MEQASGQLFPACCFPAGGQRHEDVGAARTALDSVFTDEVMAALKEQAAPGCVLCYSDAWEEDGDG